MNNNSLPKELINFNDIENEIFGFVCNLGLNMLKDTLEKLDDELFKERNKKQYRYKFKTKKTIQTVMGDVVFERRYYIEKSTKQGIYLIDKALELNLIGRTSPNLIINMIDDALRMSYRESQKDILEKTRTSASHQTIKNKVDFIGERIKALENERIAEYLNGESKGKKKVKILFEEKDGVFLKIQGKKNMKELKLAKIYEGWEKNNEVYSTVGTRYFAGYEDRKVFDNLVNSGIAEIYDVNFIDYTILNGDAASWISAEAEINDQMIYQLDLFHIYQKSTRKIKDKKARNKVKKLIKKKEYKKLLESVKDLIDSEEDEKAKENLEELYKYYENNFDSLTRYQDKEGIEMPIPPNGVEYRGLGTMESSIHNVLANRMKNNGMSWSIEGANNLSKLLCFKHSKILHDKLNELLQDKHKIEIVNIKELIKKQISQAKTTVNNEVKKAIKYMKSKKVHKCTEGKIIYGGGKVTRTSTILKTLSQCQLLNNIL